MPQEALSDGSYSMILCVAFFVEDGISFLTLIPTNVYLVLGANVLFSCEFVVPPLKSLLSLSHVLMRNLISILIST